MNTWVERSIKQVAQVRLGKMIQPAAKAVTDVTAPYLRAAHIQPEGRLIEVDDKEMWFDPLELRTLDLRPDDVVVVEGGAGFGRSAHLEHGLPGWGFQNSIVRVRPRTGVSCGRYLNYVFQSLLRVGRTGLEASVATIPHYTAEKVAATRLPMPSLSQQRDIADFLDRETAQIDAMIDAQEALVAALVARRLARVVEAVRLRATDEELLGDWRSMPFKAAISKRFTGEWGADEGVDEVDVACVRVADFDRSQRRAGATIPTIRSLPAIKAQTKELEAGDLLLERSGGTARNPVGNVILYEGPGGAVCSNFIECIRLNEDQDPEFWCYLHEAAYSTGFTHQFVRQTTGIQNLDTDGFYSEHFAVPHLSEQRQIVQGLAPTIGRLDAAIAAARDVMILLRERREALITAAVTGRIDPTTGIEHTEEAS